ncbi:MAG TPA: acyl-CoA thioesterase [Acidimicrobiales bacterium]
MRDGPVVGEVVRRVPPRHCDAQAMLHASRPAEYFEDAFLAWLDAACGGYDRVRAEGADLVIAETTTRYLGSARLDEQVVARATPVERGDRSLRVRFDLLRAPGEGDGDADEQVLVTATTAYVCVGPDGPTPLPPVLAAALAGVRARGARLAHEGGDRDTGPDG